MGREIRSPSRRTNFADLKRVTASAHRLFRSIRGVKSSRGRFHKNVEKNKTSGGAVRRGVSPQKGVWGNFPPPERLLDNATDSRQHQSNLSSFGLFESFGLCKSYSCDNNLTYSGGGRGLNVGGFCVAKIFSSVAQKKSRLTTRRKQVSTTP